MKIKKIDNVLILILAFCLTIFTTWNYTVKPTLVEFVLQAIIPFLVIFFVLSFAWKKLDKFELKTNRNKFLKKEFIYYSIIILIPMIIGAIAYYPVLYNYDTYQMWESFRVSPQGDWHPVLYTNIFFGIPHLISNNIFASSIFQLAFIFIILMFFCYYCRKKYLTFKQMLILLVTITFNPLFIKYSMYVIKDIPYSWCMLILTIVLVDIVTTDGESLKKMSIKILLILSGIGILIIRHNGIAPFILTFMLLIICVPKARKFVIISSLSILSIFFLIKGPIFQYFGVMKGGGITEMLGLMMHNISYYYNDNVSFSYSEKELLYKIAPKGSWKRSYLPRSFNDIKYDAIGYEYTAKENFSDLFSLWLEKTVENPDVFVRAYLNITSPIWEVKSTMESFEDIDFGGPDPGGINKKFYDVFNNYYEAISNNPIRWIFVGFGEGLFIIIFALFIVIKRRGLKLKYFVPFVPALVNTAIMFVLMPGEDYRLVYHQITCCFILLFYSLNLTSKKMIIKK